MTPQQALALLDSIVQQVPMKRADHGQAMEALKVLKDLIPKEAPPS